MTTPTFDEFRELSLFDEAEQDDATTAPVEEDIELDPAEVLGDLWDLVDGIFNTWVSDGEEKWALHAYDALRRQGLLSDGEPLDHAVNAVLLCTIGALSRTFYSYAYDEGSYNSWSYDLPNVIGEYPQISQVSIGRLAESLGVSAESAGWDEDPYDLLRELIRHFAPDVVAALLSEFTDSWLLVNMWAVPRDEVSYPLPDDHPAWGQLHAPSGGAINAFQWISEGMPLWD